MALTDFAIPQSCAFLSVTVKDKVKKKKKFCEIPVRTIAACEAIARCGA